MSVAFRRESDEEHLEPKFELPIPAGPNLVTAHGLALIGERLAVLEAAIAAETDEAVRTDLQRKLRYWGTRQATAQLMPAPSGDVVAFGSRVRFRLGGAERAIDIVGDDEADPAAGRIAFSAPLARAMMGAQAGDFADFGGKPDAIEIVLVEAIPD
jgi:transcription elongation GreA/GreB family factor